ncbi:Dcp1p-Dcp2p decapping enzyme complex alpha subunit [Podila epigama]|nr:Dcp1p-Dcp2p decapping enzyme complex alpha subunit [Podila epigama]
MPFDFGIPIDPAFRKVLQSRIRTLLQAKMEGFPGSYPVFLQQDHLVNLTAEEYFVMEKVAGVRYMLLSTITPKGPACFLIDRHFEITFVPQLLLPLRDNPSKCQNETLLDGEMIVETDGSKKTLRFLVFDLMVLNGTVVTQRSYSTRLGMMDQDILAVQSGKTQEVKSKEPFTIERKTMQRSYGLNVILSGSKRHKHGGEGLIFVPVKRPYVPGVNSKMLKWKSHITAQFQVKVTQSKERKPLYCIQSKQGSGYKFYDYVTPEPGLASEWHNNSPDGKTFEFWWDAQWPTQMFEKGYGLETRTGGWRFYRIREDRKEADDELTIQATVKSMSSSVTKEQLESQIDNIRTQWKAREQSGGSISITSSSSSANGGAAPPSSSTQRPPVRPLTIMNNSSLENQPLPTPAISSHYLQSPSGANHIGTLGYFPRKDRERKSSIDDYNQTNTGPSTTVGTFSHPLPPKPPPQLRQPSVDHSSPSPAPAPAVSSLKNGECDSTGSKTPPSSVSSVSSSTKASESKISSPVTNSSNTPADGQSSSPPAQASTSPAPPSTTSSSTIPKTPLKLSQIPDYLQPIKSWMTVTPAPRALPERPVKSTKAEKGDKADTVSPKSASPRPTGSQSISRKSSLANIDNQQEQKDAPTTPVSTQPDNSLSASSVAPVAPVAPPLPSTTTPPHTMSAPTAPTQSIPLLPPSLPQSSSPSVSTVVESMPTPASTPSVMSASNLILPATSLSSMPTETCQEDGDAQSTGETFQRDDITNQTPMSSGPLQLLATVGVSSQAPSPILGKRSVGSSSAGENIEDSMAQKRKLSDAHPSPRTESVLSGIGTLHLAPSLSPRVVSRQLQVSTPSDNSNQGSMQGSPVNTPRDVTSVDVPQIQSNHRKASMLSQELSVEGNMEDDNTVNKSEKLERSKVSDMDMDIDQDSTIQTHVKGAQMDVNAELDVQRGDHAIRDVNTDQLHSHNSLVLDVSSSTHAAQVSREPTQPKHGQSESISKQGQSDAMASRNIYIPKVTLTAAEQQAYSMPSEKQKRAAIAKATAAAVLKLEVQREKQAIKERRRQEEVEKLKMNTKAYRAKVQKMQEAAQLLASQKENQVQDRRAQPVRQTQQQARMNQASDTISTRGQGQHGQRSAAQETPRLYQTRGSRSAAPRTEPQQEASQTPDNREQSSNSQATQRGQAKQSSQQQSQQPQKPSSTKVTGEGMEEQRGGVAKNRGSSPSPPGTKAVASQESTRGNHRRINSMEYNPQMSQSMGSLGSAGQYGESYEGAGDNQYGQPPSKRLDVGLHPEVSHRRSHSDIGAPQQPNATAPNAVHAQSMTKPQTVQGDVRHGSPTGWMDRQGLPTDGPQRIMTPREGHAGRNTMTPTHSLRDQPPAKRESKATLQFILNEDNPSPESHPPGDYMEYASEGRPWVDARDANSLRPPTQSWQAPSSSGFQQSLVNERHSYVPQEQDVREMTSAPGSAQAPVPASARRQTTKKQKMGQQEKSVEMHYGNKGEPYDMSPRNSPAHHGQPFPPNVNVQGVSNAPQEQWSQQKPRPQQRQQPPAMPTHGHTQQSHHATQAHGPQHPQQVSPQGAQPPMRRSLGDVQEPAYPSSLHPGGRHFAGSTESLHVGHLPPRSGGGQPDCLPAGVSRSPVHTEAPRQAQERPTHSRHSSLTKPIMVPEQGPPGYPTRSVPPHAMQGQGPHPGVDPYLRQMPPGQDQPPSNVQHTPMSVDAQQQQQQHPGMRNVDRRKESVEHHHSGHHPSSFSQSQVFGPPHGGAEQGQYAAQVQAHPQQQQHQMHPSFMQQQQRQQQQQQQQQLHAMQAQVRPPPEQDPHGTGRVHGHGHKPSLTQMQLPPQHPQHPQHIQQQQQQQQQQRMSQSYRNSHHEPSTHSPPQPYYDQDGRPTSFGPGRPPSTYGSQPLHSRPTHERQPSYQSYPQVSAPLPEHSYRPHPSGMRGPDPEAAMLTKEDHLRVHGGREPVGPMPGEHGLQHVPLSSHRQYQQQQQQQQMQPQQHAPAHPQRSQHPQHPQQPQQPQQQQQQHHHEYQQQGGAPYHPHSQQQQQQGMMPYSEHGQQYYPPHHGVPPKIPSPQRVPPGHMGDPTGEQEPVYRPSIPHGHGGQRW